MNAAEQINGIIDEIEKRVATALGLTNKQVYESRQAGTGSGKAAYVHASMPRSQPMTGCAEEAEIHVEVGFMLPADARPLRVQRMGHTMALRSALLWGPGFGTPIPNVGLPLVADMAVSERGDPDDGFLTGGLTYVFHTVLQKGA